MSHGLTRQPHTSECRERFRQLMRDEARVVFSEERQHQFAAEELARQERKQEKKNSVVVKELRRDK